MFIIKVPTIREKYNVLMKIIGKWGTHLRMWCDNRDSYFQCDLVHAPRKFPTCLEQDLENFINGGALRFP